mgnify:CR=1 FL=1
MISFLTIAFWRMKEQIVAANAISSRKSTQISGDMQREKSFKSMADEAQGESQMLDDVKPHDTVR